MLSLVSHLKLTDAALHFVGVLLDNGIALRLGVKGSHDANVDVDMG
jgi:hypothetical protein